MARAQGVHYARRVSDPELEAIVRALIAGGESYYVEFKSSWTYGPEGREPRDRKQVAQDIGEALVAFANSDGGDLLIGVEDSGTITGVPWEGDQLLYLVQSARNKIAGGVDLGAKVHDLVIDGHRVLLFRVRDPSSEIVSTADGRCLWRRGARSEPVPPPDIERRRRQRLGDTIYEAQPVPAASFEDLTIPWDVVASRLHLQGFAYRRDTAALLRYWNLVEGRNGSTVLRRAALLLFATDPRAWHPNNRLRIRRVHGADEGFGRQLGTREIAVSGPLLSILSETPRKLRPILESEARGAELFATAHLLPPDAVDECTVNAVAHRNYAIEGSAIEVLLFPDRVEFRSPGKLPEPLTIDDLKEQRGVHRSRNPLLMRVLRDLGWTRDQGEGMRRIFGAMSQVELHEPELEEVSDTFIVRLSTRSIHDEETQAWIAAYGPYGLLPEERKYMVALRRAEDASLSVDRLARALGEPFDKTKPKLVELERKGLVWHAPKSRNYHLVEPLVVPHERAYRLLTGAHVRLAADTSLDMPTLQRIVRAPDEQRARLAVDRWRESGILAPAGKGQWKLGQSFLAYVDTRAS